MFIRTCSNILKSSENLIAGVALLVVLASVIWGVLTRYVISQPAIWANELSGLAFTWVVFIGTLIAFRKNAHVKVPIILDILPTPFKNIIIILNQIIILFFLGYSIHLSYIMMIKGSTRFSPVMGIPFSYVYLSALIAFSGMLLYGLFQFYPLIKSLKKGN